MPKCEVEFDSLPEKLGKNCNNNIDIFFLRYFDLKPVKPNGCLGTLVPSTTNGETEMRMVPSFYRVFTEFLVLLSLSLSISAAGTGGSDFTCRLAPWSLYWFLKKRERERERCDVGARRGVRFGVAAPTPTPQKSKDPLPTPRSSSSKKKTERK